MAYASTYVATYDRQASQVEVAAEYLGYDWDELPQDVKTWAYGSTVDGGEGTDASPNLAGLADFANTLSSAASPSGGFVWTSSRDGVFFTLAVDDARRDMTRAVKLFNQQNQFEDSSINRTYVSPIILTKLVGDDNDPITKQLLANQTQINTINSAVINKYSVILCGFTSATSGTASLSGYLLFSDNPINISATPNIYNGAWQTYKVNVTSTTNITLRRLNGLATNDNGWNIGTISGNANGNNISTFNYVRSLWQTVGNSGTQIKYPYPIGPTKPEMPADEPPTSTPVTDTPYTPTGTPTNPTGTPTNNTYNTYNVTNTTTTVDLQPILDALNIINENVKSAISRLNDMNANLVTIINELDAANDNLEVLHADLLAINGNLDEFGANFAGYANSMQTAMAKLYSMVRGSFSALNDSLDTWGNYFGGWMQRIVDWLQMIYYRIPTAVSGGGGGGGATDLTELLEQLAGDHEELMTDLLEINIRLRDILKAIEGLGGEYQPSVPDGVTPDEQLAIDADRLKTKFPFSIPWDLAALLMLLEAPSEALVFDWPVPYMGDVRIDLTVYAGVAAVSRAVSLFCFGFFLILKTKSIVIYD